MRASRTVRALALVCALIGLGAGPAHAVSPAAEAAAAQVFMAYATDGKIDPCRYSLETLELALKTVTPDIEQYASEYPEAIRAAIADRAREGCGGDSSEEDAGSGAPAPPSATPAPPGGAPTVEPGAPTETVVPEPPAPDAGSDPPPTGAGSGAVAAAGDARPDGRPPLPLIALAGLVVGVALLGLLALAFRRLGIGDERFAGAGHAWREARWRWRGAWADFSDWLARGR